MFKDFLLLALAIIFFAEQNFSRKPYEEHLGEIILNLDQQFRRCYLKDFSNFSYGSHFVQWSGTVCAILAERLMRNI